MTGEQQNPKATSPPAFGEILINPQAGTSDNEKKKSALPPEPKKTRKQQKKPKESKGSSKKKVLRCSLILILLPTVLFLTYLAAARFILPYYIQEQLAEQYSQQLQRPVTVTQVDFDPFTFDLHFAGIHIGPKFDRQDGDEPALCRIATLDTRLRPQELLQRRIVLENIQIKGMQAEVVRRTDGSFTDLGLVKKGEAEMANQALLPTWMRIDGLSLTDSMLVIRDAANGHKYLLDEITFSLPSTAPKEGETEPTLHALINGNPIQIRGQRQIRPDGSSATRLILQLDDVDPQQILAWLPGINNSLRISTDKTKAELELLLPDNLQGDSGPVLSGTIHSTGLHLAILTHSNESEVKRSGKLQCIAPSAQLVIRANPFRKQYTVEELTLESPQLVLTENNGKSTLPQQPLSLWPGQLLAPASLPFDLMIHRLTINKGTLQKENGLLWNDLQLELTTYRNRDIPSEEETQGAKPGATTLTFSARQEKTTVQFQGTAAPDLSLIGKVSLNNLDSSTLQPYLGKNKAVQLAEGKAQLVMQVNPLLKQYKVEELTLDQPRFILADSKEKSNLNRLPLSGWPGQLLDPASLPFDLMIHRLTINKGTLQKENGLLWNDLQLELTAYRNRDTASSKKKVEKATALSFSVHQGGTTVKFQGTTASDLSLTGKISLNNLDPNLLQPYLNAREDVQLASGQAEVSGLLRTMQAKEGGKKKILLDKGTITLRDIRLKRKKQGEDKVLLTAQMAESKECSIDLDLASPSLSCADLLLQEANFSPEAPSFFLFPEKAGSPISPLGLSIDALKIIDSKASLPLDSKKNGLTIPLTALNLEIKDLQAAQSKKDNLHFQAGIGTDGKATADGSFRQGKGSLNLTVEGLDIKLLNQTFAQLFQKELAPTLHQGLLSLQGKLGLPELDFEGDARLNDLIAENSQGTALRWKSGEGRQVLAGMHPFYIHIGELALQEPELQLNSPESKLPAALLSLLRTQDKKPVLPPFTIKQCSIQEGSMPGAGTHLGFTAINGNLVPLAAETPTYFTFSGKVNEREFTTQGRLEQGHAEFDNFSVAELSLDNAAKEFAQQLGLEEKGEIRWVPSAEQKDGGSVHFSGFIPQPDAEFSLLLALLTDSEGKFSLPLSLPATASPVEISDAALKKLHRLHLQTVVSPQAVLEKNIPDLALPQRIAFIVGDRLPDFMDNLENFAPLFTRRPHLSLRLRGCYDDRADREYLLRLLQEEEDYRIDLENVRRQEEMARLLAEEELRQVELVNTDMPIGEDLLPVIEAREDLQPLPHQQIELPKEILPELARQRALVVQEYFIDTLKLPAEKISLAEPAPGGPRVDLQIEAIWQQPPETTQAPSQGQEE